MVIGTGWVEGNCWLKKPVIDLGFVATEWELNETKTSFHLCVVCCLLLFFFCFFLIYKIQFTADSRFPILKKNLFLQSDLYLTIKEGWGGRVRSQRWKHSVQCLLLNQTVCSRRCGCAHHSPFCAAFMIPRAPPQRHGSAISNCFFFLFFGLSSGLGGKVMPSCTFRHILHFIPLSLVQSPPSALRCLLSQACA